MLTIKKELLKQFLFHELLGYIVSEYSDYKSDSNFKFEFSGEDILFICTSSYTYGADCYDSEQKTERTSLGCINEYHLTEVLENLYISDIDEKICEKYQKPFNLIEYYDQLNNLKNYYFNEREENVNHDYYNNYDTVKTTFIPINDIAEFLIKFSWSKPDQAFLDALKYIDKNQFDQLIKIYLKDSLEENLLINNEKSRKNKI